MLQMLKNKNAGYYDFNLPNQQVIESTEEP